MAAGKSVAVCTVCSKDLLLADPLTACFKCGIRYHSECVGLGLDEHNWLGERPNFVFTCDKCLLSDHHYKVMQEDMLREINSMKLMVEKLWETINLNPKVPVIYNDFVDKGAENSPRRKKRHEQSPAPDCPARACRVPR